MAASAYLADGRNVDEETPQSARKAIVEKIARNPQVMENMFGKTESMASSQQQKQFFENALMKKLQTCHDVQDTLRKYGMEDDVEGTRQVVELLPLAIQAPPEYSKGWCTSNQLRAGGACLFAIALAGPLFYEKIVAQASWTHGKCKIDGFYNRNCMAFPGNCVLNIRFFTSQGQEDGQKKMLQKNNWSPTSKNDIGNPGQVVFSDHEGVFCDDWAYNNYENGHTCRFEPGWSCRARFSDVDVIDELEAYEEPTWLFWAMGIMAVLIILVVFFWIFWSSMGVSLCARLGGVTWHRRLAERLETAVAERTLKREEKIIREMNLEDSNQDESTKKERPTPVDENEFRISDEEKPRPKTAEKLNEMQHDTTLKNAAVAVEPSSPQSPSSEDLAVEDLPPLPSSRSPARLEPPSPTARASPLMASFSGEELGTVDRSPSSTTVKSQPKVQPGMALRGSASSSLFRDLSKEKQIRLEALQSAYREGSLIRDLSNEQEIEIEKVHSAYKDGFHPSSPKPGMQRRELHILAKKGKHDPRLKLIELEPRLPASALANEASQSRYHRSPSNSPSRKKSPSKKMQHQDSLSRSRTSPPVSPTSQGHKEQSTGNELLV